MDDNITAPRKLTSTETSRLRSLLHSKLTLRPGDEQSKEDAADLLDYAFAMIANGKDVKYVVAELKSMEMEVCNSGSAEMLGRTLGKFLFDLKNGSGGGGGDNDVPTAERRGNSNRGETSVTTMKSTNNNNAMPPHTANMNDRRVVGGRDGIGGGGRNNFERQSSSGRGGGPGRGASLHNAAFQRLNHNSSGISPQDQHRNRCGPPPPPPYGNSRGGRGDNWGGGRAGPSGRGRNGGGGGRGDNIQGGGRGGGRDIVMVGFNNNQRGDQQQQQFNGGGRDPQYSGRGGVNGGRIARGGGDRPFQYNELLGTRRTREEEKEMERGGLSSGRGDIEQQQQPHTKKHRWVNGDDDYAEQQQPQKWGGGNDEMMTESYQGRTGGRGGYYQGRGGRSGGRVRGRGGGRFASTAYYPNNNEQEGEGAGDYAEATDYSPTEEAAFVSESPLIAASFGRGRGRGFYRGGRGRGRGGREVGAGRAEVAEKLSAMVWKRPRTIDEGLSTAR